jgi:intracellular multiplication protein IcmD
MGLTGCGDSENASFVVSDTNSGTVGGANVIGRIDPELLVTDGVVGSALGPATVTGNSFSTRISTEGVGLLALEDGGANVRGFALTFPGETPVISFESTVFAAVSMEPGFLRLQAGPGREQIAAIRSTPGFLPFVSYLRNNAGIPLDFLSGEPEFKELLGDILASLGNPLLDGLAVPAGSASGQTVTLQNPSPRFLSISRDGQTLPDLLPPFGTLTDVAPAGQSPDYSLFGVGTLDNGDPDDNLVDRTFPSTVQASLLLPLYELAAGKRLSLEAGLNYFQTLGLDYPPLGTAAHDELLLASALQSSFAANLGELSADSFSGLSQILAQQPSIPGLGFSIGAILKFKQHKDNPTQTPIGTPIALVFIAAALLFLPSIIGITGETLFGDDATPPAEPS